MRVSVRGDNNYIPQSKASTETSTVMFICNVTHECVYILSYMCLHAILKVCASQHTHHKPASAY